MDSHIAFCDVGNRHLRQGDEASRKTPQRKLAEPEEYGKMCLGGKPGAGIESRGMGQSKMYIQLSVSSYEM